jgi:hypothetical protein
MLFFRFTRNVAWLGGYGARISSLNVLSQPVLSLSYCLVAAAKSAPDRTTVSLELYYAQSKARTVSTGIKCKSSMTYMPSESLKFKSLITDV